MAFEHGKSAKLYAGGYDLTGFLKSIKLSRSVDEADTTTLGNNDKKRIAGLRDASLSADGIFDGDDNGIDDVFSAALGGASQQILYFPQGDAEGDAAYGLYDVKTAYSIDSPIDDVVTVALEASATGGSERLLTYHALASVNGNGASSVVDNAAASTGGGAAYVQVSAIAGGGTLTIKVQDSADNVTFADLITMTAVTTAPITERIAVTGTVRRYTKVTWTLTAGTATFVAGFGRK